MTIEEAIGKAKFYACSSYLTSEKVYEITQPYHKGDNELFVHACRAIASQGIDVVDDCVENAYKLVFNIDHEGEALDEKDAKTLTEYVKGIIDAEVIPRKGRLQQAGIVFGIVGSQVNKYTERGGLS